MAQHHWLTQRALLLLEQWFAKDQISDKLLRYQTTHERAFHKALADLLKLRSERRKTEIGFESLEQKKAEEVRREAAESRKQELHKLAVLMAEAQLTHRQALTSNAEMTATELEFAKQLRETSKKAA